MSCLKRYAVFLMAASLLFSSAAASAESGTSEIDKVLSIASWLLGSAIEMQETAQKEEDSISAMMWMYNEENSAAPEDVKEIAALLKALGIEGIADESVEQVRARAVKAAEDGYVFSREMAALDLLYAVGMGTYDDDFVWQPSSDMVLCLDMELFGGETLYGDFFKGLNSICGGEFVFADIREDYSEANLEAGEGEIHLSFLMNGTAYRCSAEMMHDWFDTAVFNEIAELAVHPDSGKRLYAMYDGMQGLIIFYNTPEWAHRFEKATACPLSTQM